MTRLSKHIGFILLLIGLTAHCGPAQDEALKACINAWSPHYLDRVPVGQTRFLPTLQSSETCLNLSWALTSAPSGSNIDLQSGTEYARITGDVPGDYVFSIVEGTEVTSATITVSYIDALTRPFHNYNYFPAATAAINVGDEIWVAGVYTPQIARVNAATGDALPPIAVGAWPVALAHAENQQWVLVANKASDTLGLVDIASGRQVDAIWVGDEPSSIVVDAARDRAYVTLAGAGQVAIVDLAERSVIKSIDAVFDPLALDISPDGATLVVASHRSGQSNMYPYGERDPATEKDIAIIDLETLEVTGHILEVSSTIHHLSYDSEGTLWVSATTNQIEGPLNDRESLSFQHEIFTLDVKEGMANRGLNVDVSRQPSSTGYTATLHGFTQCAGSLWVIAEGSDQAIALNNALEEERRVPVLGRPRVILCHDDTVWAVSSNRMEITRIVLDTAETYSLGLSDTRSPELKAGLEHFTGQGDTTADNRSCNNCHADGLTDGVVWNAGPVPNRELTRPLRWLEGTAMIGWDGYVGSVKVSGYVGGSTINHRPNSDEALALGAYLASMMPSPPANSWTHRDGSLSKEGQEGKALFEGKGACTGCHSGYVTTNKAILADGLTPGKTDVPSMVDVYRIGSWYKTGEMATLRDTVADTAEKFGTGLTDQEIDKVTRYLMEQTGRDFFVLDANFGPSIDAFSRDGTVTLTFSYPFLDSAENISRIQLLDSSATPVEATVTVDGRHVTVRAKKWLEPATAYTLEVAAGTQADDARVTTEITRYAITTAAKSDFKLAGDYKWTVTVPMLNFAEGGFDWNNLVDQTSTFSAKTSASGASITMDYGSDLLYEDVFVLDGNTLLTQHIPVALGPSFLNGNPMEAEVQDTDGDGTVDLIEGKIHLTGPGVDLEGVDFSMTRVDPSVSACIPGSEGDHPPVITQDGDTVTIDWGDAGALALLVTSPEATLPLGPGTVEGGEAYWVIAATNFPDTFSGPVTYGTMPENATDASVDNGAPEGGAAFESGKCYRFSVVVDFAFSHTIMIWP